MMNLIKLIGMYFVRLNWDSEWSYFRIMSRDGQVISGAEPWPSAVTVLLIHVFARDKNIPYLSL